MDRPIRIVVGEGRTAQRGLLRFVLEGEGFQVVGETSSTADLPEVITSQQPDVVVLDDGIGVMAVSMVHDVAPDAKVVLVWPAAVVPIGGDARVEPAKILKDLGPAVEHVAVAAGIGTGLTHPEWIDKVRKDPATLRSKLAKTGGIAAIGGAAAKRRNVTRLQRRSRRLHPSTQEAPTDTARADDDAAVVVLPVVAAGAASAANEPILDLSGTDAPVDAAPDEVEEPSEWNRRLGTLAMSGAAAVSALVLALALGGGRIQPSILRGSGEVPLGVPGFVQPGGAEDGGGSFGFGFGGLGGSGYDPSASAAAYEARLAAAAAAADRNGGSTDAPPRLLAPDEAGSGDDVATPPSGDTGGGGNGGSDGGGGNGGNVGGHGNGGGNDAGADSALPGKSAAHNPHGGPPGQTGLTPAHGPGLGVANGQVEGKQHPHKS